MKAIVILLLSAAALHAADPVPGDSRERVLDLLGNAQGRMQVKGNEVLFYDRGTVELNGGRVTRVQLVTSEQLEFNRIAAERKAKQDALERERLRKEGGDAKRKTLEEGTLSGKPPAEQVAFWQDFARRYPEVDVSAELQKAQELVQDEERRRQQAALAARKAQEEEPKLNSSKRRKYMRAGLLKDEETP